jgi:hypothetical protein
MTSLTKKNYHEYCIEIFVESEYEDKDKLKKLGAKWNATKKQWYFRYNYKNFYDNVLWVSAFEFHPDSIKIVKWDNEETIFKKVKISKEDKKIIYQETVDRWTLYNLNTHINGVCII